MINKKQLISSLTSEISPGAPIHPPSYWAVRLIAVLVIYALVMPFIIGIRPDLNVQLTRLPFITEIVMLAALAISSALAAIFAMYPDAYQKQKLLKIPYFLFAIFSAFMVSQLFMSVDKHMIMQKPGAHGLECALCIGAVSIVPSAIIFTILRKGSSTNLYRSGSLAVLAASAIGCIKLRIAEANDSIIHIVTWHYIPTLLFASLGAILGKKILKW